MMKKLFLGLIFTMSVVAFSGCEKEAEPVPIEPVLKDKTIIFDIKADSRYSDVRWNNAYITISYGIEKYNKKTGQKETILDVQLPKQLFSYYIQNPQVITKVIPKVNENDEIIRYGYAKKYEVDGLLSMDALGTEIPSNIDSKTVEIRF